MTKAKVILGSAVAYDTIKIDVEKLRFRLSHPRIYFVSKKEKGDRSLSQEVVYAILIKRNHVKKLVKDILRHESVVEPIVVEGKNFEVLEGNSRLAACKYILDNHKLLAKQGEDKYNRVRKNIKQIDCIVLDKNISESHLFSLLAQYHLRGKRAWDPYEKADYALRRFNDINKNKSTKESYEQVVQEIGIDLEEVMILCANIKMMKKYNETNIKKYSCYNVVNENKSVRVKLEASVENEELIVKAIRNNTKPSTEFRTMITRVCRNERAAKLFFEQGRSLGDASKV